MNPQRIAVKFFVSPDPSAPVDLEPFTPLFHEWIQKGTVPGLLIDVADYAHVPDGPGIVLIGHEVDYALDQTGGRSGLLTVRKRHGDAPLSEVLPDALQRALLAIAAIGRDGRSGLHFDLASAELQLLDRLAAPNDEDAWEVASAEAAPAFDALWGSATLERIGADDPRKPLGLRAAATAATDPIDALIARVSR